jgi:hypothetical protein
MTDTKTFNQENYPEEVKKAIRHHNVKVLALTSLVAVYFLGGMAIASHYGKERKKAYDKTEKAFLACADKDGDGLTVREVRDAYPGLSDRLVFYNDRLPVVLQDKIFGDLKERMRSNPQPYLEIEATTDELRYHLSVAEERGSCVSDRLNVRD